MTVGFPVLDPNTVATIVLVIELAFASALLLGFFLVRRGHVRRHAWLQSFVVLGNVPIVALWMLPQYLEYVWPGLPDEVGQPFYLYPTLMLVAGAAVEALGVYIILVAGTSWLPERLRFRRYKVWMRTMLGLWWAVILFGILTYYVWVVAPTGS